MALQASLQMLEDDLRSSKLAGASPTGNELATTEPARRAPEQPSALDCCTSQNDERQDQQDSKAGETAPQTSNLE